MRTTSTFRVLPVPGSGAEDVLVGPDDGPWAGWVLTGTEDGWVWRLRTDGSRVERVGRVPSRALGLEWLPDGRVLVCANDAGLHALDPASGRAELLCDRVDGVPMRVCNNAAVAADGTIWFSDSSTRYGLDRWRDDLVQLTRTGRLLRLAAGAAEPEVVVDGLAFANGVALSAAEDFVVVAETAGRTVVRRWLRGPRSGERDLLCGDLPGYPDNLARGTDGLIWVTIASPTTPVVSAVQRAPRAVRRAATRLPEALQPAPRRTVRVQAFDDDGRLCHDVDVDPAEHGVDYHAVTGVREHHGAVWMASFVEPAVAVLDR